METQTLIEITFRLTQRDLYRVYIRVLVKLWLLIPIAICMVGILALSALMDLTARTSYLIPASRFVLGAAAVVGVVFVLPYFLARNTMKTSPLFQREVRCSITESGVEMKTPASQSQVEWSGFHRAVELKDFLLIYLSSRVFYIIPKRSFSGPDQLEAFKSLLRRKMEGKVRLKS